MPSPSTSLPPLFVAHGPPGAPPSGRFAEDLAAWGRELPRPRGVLVVSAHWSERSPTRGSTASLRAAWTARGEELHACDPRWSPPGAPELAHELAGLLPNLERAPERGWDEGVWGPLRCLMPEADVPVLQLSLITGATPTKLYALGRRIGALASMGYLIVGSGAVTLNEEHRADDAAADPAPFARAFDAWVGNVLADAEMELLLRWRAEAPDARLANPTGQPLAPLFVVAGAASLYDNAVGFPVRGFAHGTVSLRCVQFGRPR